MLSNKTNTNGGGKPHGHGKMTYANGDVYEGELKDGKPNGKGKMTYADGSVYEGEFQNGERHGKGKLTLGTKLNDTDGVYEGEWKYGKMDGQGTKTLFHGKVGENVFYTYKGAWKDGEKHGIGTETLVGKHGVSVFEGMWKENLLDGHGTATYSSGMVYEGDYKRNLKHGQGKMTYSGASVYERGSGWRTYAKGDEYEGNWKDNMKHGEGKMTYANGDVYEGEWKDGKAHGKGKMTYADGDVYEGEWRDGKPLRGKWKRRSSDPVAKTLNDSDENSMAKRRKVENPIEANGDVCEGVRTSVKKVKTDADEFLTLAETVWRQHLDQHRRRSYSKIELLTVRCKVARKLDRHLTSYEGNVLREVGESLQARKEMQLRREAVNGEDSNGSDQ